MLSVSPCVRWLEHCATRSRDQETHLVWQCEYALSTASVVCHHVFSDALNGVLIRKARLLGLSF